MYMTIYRTDRYVMQLNILIIANNKSRLFRLGGHSYILTKWKTVCKTKWGKENTQMTQCIVGLNEQAKKRLFGFENRKRFSF